MKLSELKGKRILILGFGREGRDAFSFLASKFPSAVLGIADVREIGEFNKEEQEVLERESAYLGKNYLEAVPEYDVLVRSPGINPEEVRFHMRGHQVMTSPTQLFFDNCPNTIIGVTGTKGKGTTASLITQVLRAGGVATELMGNIGNPALSFLSKTKKDTVVVFELSSFQLLGLEKSPHIAVLVNVYPEHLDYHGSFEAYREAKARITLFQGPKDILIYEEENDGCREIAKHTKAKKIAFTKSAPMIPGRLPFVASPNPAVIIGRMYKVPEAVIKKATLSFEPLPHRLEPVGTFRGITFVNDSMGTTMPAVIAAIETLKGEVATIILGGRGKGESSYDELAQAVVESGIKHVILFPETGGEIWKAVEQLKKGRFPEAREAHDMEEAVRLCYELTRKGKTCLLSPAAASFNMFRDYKDRGEQFAKYAKHYGKEK